MFIKHRIECEHKTNNLLVLNNSTERRNTGNLLLHGNGRWKIVSNHYYIYGRYYRFFLPIVSPVITTHTVWLLILSLKINLNLKLNEFRKQHRNIEHRITSEKHNRFNSWQMESDYFPFERAVIHSKCCSMNYIYQIRLLYLLKRPLNWTFQSNSIGIWFHSFLFCQTSVLNTFLYVLNCHHALMNRLKWNRNASIIVEMNLREKTTAPLRYKVATNG